MGGSSTPFIKTHRETNLTSPWKEHSRQETCCSAVFAALIQIKTARQNENFRWGFNLGALLDEAIGRQRLFIESQHFPDELGYSESHNFQDPPPHRCFSIRAINSPGTEKLQLAVIGKISSGTEEQAQADALEYWQEIKSTFPLDYRLVPATNESDFMLLCGWDILEQANDISHFAEIAKYENYFNNNYYLLGGWNTSKTANEQIWRVLAGANQNVIYDISIRPTILTYDDLQTAYGALVNSKMVLAETSDDYKAWINHGTERWQKFLDEVKHPYLVQIRLVSDQPLPSYLARTIGFAHAHHDEVNPVIASFALSYPKTGEEIHHWVQQMRWLEIDLKASENTLPEMKRLRKMVNAEDATNLFRLPYPSAAGLPGVKFISSRTTKKGEGND